MAGGDASPYGISLILPESGYRHSLDPLLLADFVRGIRAASVCDLGTGGGILPLLLAARYGFDRVTGVEIQPEVAERARESVRMNGMADRISVIAGDIREIRTLASAQSVDLVVSNPPYRPAGNGRLSKGDERALSRHELAGGIGDFADAAGYLLKHGGRFAVVFLAERLTDLLGAMRRSKMEPKRLRMVHSREAEDACLVLVEGRKGGKPGMVIESPLILYAGENYTPEVEAIFRGERLPRPENASMPGGGR